MPDDTGDVSVKRTLHRGSSMVGAAGALLLLASLAAVAPGTASGTSLARAYRLLPKPTTVSIPAIISAKPSGSSAPADRPVVSMEFEREAQGERAAVPYTSLGGANARGSSVVGGSSAAQGFPGLDLVQQSSAGTGEYAGTGSGLEPPDQALCVGNGYVMEGVNQAWRIYNTRGVPLTPPILLSQFHQELPFTLVGETSFLSDPKCIYDADTKRFFATSLQADMPTYGVFGRAHNLLAVSKTSDPTKEWFLYRFDVTNDGLEGTPLHPTCPCIGDQPLIGADRYGFYISTNEYSDLEIVPVEPPPLTKPILTRAFTLPDFRNGQAQLYAMSKQALVKGRSGPIVELDTADIPVPPTAELGSVWSSLQPAFQPPRDGSSLPSSGVEYFLSRAPKVDYSTAPSQEIEVWAWTNTASLTTASPNLELQHVTLKTSDTYTFPDSASQKDGPKPLAEDCLPDPCEVETLNANDDRMNQVMLTNGHLWSALNTLLPPIDETAEGRESEPRTGIMYFDVVPALSNGKLTAKMNRDGYINVPRESVLFPSIAASPRGPVVMSFTLSGIDYFPSAAWTRLDGVPAGKAPEVHISSMGVAPEDGFSGYCVQGILSNLFGECTEGKARWGDYSAAVVDEHGCIWSGVEYISGIRRLDGVGNWSTFVTRIATEGCVQSAALTPAERSPLAGPVLAPCLPLFTSAEGSDDTVVAHGETPQLDIIRGDMKLSPDGKTVTTVITLKDLSKEIPAGGISNGYSMRWTYKGVEYISTAFVDPTGEVVYTAGPSESSGDDEATGSFNEGPGGTVEVNVPLAHVGNAKRGDIFRQPVAETDDGVFFVDRPGSMFDYQVGLVCAKASSKSQPTVKGAKQVRGGTLPATGLADGPAILAGLSLLVLAVVTARRIRLAR